jgi:hypothetical protein
VDEQGPGGPRPTSDCRFTGANSGEALRCGVELWIVGKGTLPLPGIFSACRFYSLCAGGECGTIRES